MCLKPFSYVGENRSTRLIQVIITIIGILVLSANIMMSDILLTWMGKSLIYMLKSSGPKTEPYGTPCLIDFQLERPF
jgi:hypothetical protein